MSDTNKSVMRRIVEECINKGNFAVCDELVANDYVYHEPTVGEKHGKDGFKQLISMYRAAFPDVRMSIDEQIAEGDYVVTCWTASGTHRGELFGIKPTGQKCTVRGTLVSRFSNGKLTQDREIWDVYGMLMQLGALPQKIKLVA